MAAKHTTAEIVIVVGAGAFLLWLWLANRGAGAGTGLEAFPQFGAPSSGNIGSPGTFDVPNSTPGYTPMPPGGAGCNSCAGTANGVGPQFGSVQDLIAYLNNTATASLAASQAAILDGDWD